MNFKVHLKLSDTEYKILLLVVAGPLIILMKIFQYLSRYYPFSLLFREKMFHYDNQHIKSLLTLIETPHNAKNKPFIVESVEKDRYFYTFYGRFKKHTGDEIQNAFKKHLAERLKTNPYDIYINKQDTGSIRIRIPKIIVQSFANSFRL